MFRVVLVKGVNFHDQKLDKVFGSGRYSISNKSRYMYADLKLCC